MCGPRLNVYVKLTRAVATDPRVVFLTGGSTEEPTFSSLTMTTRLWVRVAAVALLPSLQLRPGPRSQFTRFYHSCDCDEPKLLDPRTDQDPYDACADAAV